MPVVGLELRVRDKEELHSASHADNLEVGKFDVDHLVLDCRSCGRRWSTAPGLDGEFPSGFWRCPRCNW